MRIICTFLLVSVLASVSSFGQLPPLFTNYSMGGSYSSEFTTNNFKCIGVGKGNRIWAGTQYGGLYTYDEGFNTWRKSSKLTNVFINDIKADADSGIWIAQSGTASVGGNSNIAGGVNYFPVNSDISMNFYSVAGTTTSADLLSRNVRSLYIDKSFGTANGRLPKVWAAQGTYITSFNTRRGGLSIGLNPFATYFTNYASGYATGTSATPISEAVGGNSEEVWIAARQNNGGSQILRYKPNSAYIDTPWTNSNVPLLQAGFSAQAIHFDIDGNRWIGMKSGGLVIKTPSGWVKMNSPSYLPAGTQINYNAITSDQYGNVYIGTSTGMLEYLCKDFNPGSSPDYTPSYNYYTTNEGLPSNNITGVAYDNKNSRVLITSDAGVTFMNKREPFIKGVVFDVYCNLDEPAKKYPGLQKIPLSSGVTVRLLRNNIEEEFVFPDANGIFELKEANETDVYTVEVKFAREGKNITYLYDNIRNHTLMQPVLMPDSLIREIKSFKEKMANRCFPIKLGFQINYTRVCKSGFDVNGYDLAYQRFYDAGGVTSDHKKKVDNLANYYTAIAGVYALGGNATELVSDMIANSLDMIEFLVRELLAKDAVKKKAASEEEAFEQAGLSVSEDFKKAGINAMKLMKAGFSESSSKISSALKGYPNVQKIFDFSAPCITETADLLIEYLENGGNMAALKAVVDNLKKIIANEVSGAFYSNLYAKDTHKNLVYESSNSAAYAVSEKSYQDVFDNVYNSNTNSLVKDGKDTLTNRKANIATLSNISKVAEASQQVFDMATLLALVPGGQVAGAIAKVLSYAAKAIKVVALCGGIYQGAIGAYEETELSKLVTDKAGLLRPSTGNGTSTLALNTPDALIAAKNNYNQRLTELQAQYDALVYNAPSYGNAYKLFAREDSIYTQEMKNSLNNLWSSTDNAIVSVPGFNAKLNRVVDSFVVPQYTLRNSLYYMNMGFIFDSDKTGYRPGLDSLLNEIRILNDSAVTGIASLIGQVNSNNISSQAFLVQESYQISHSRVPGTSGSITYSFKNYGGEPQTNVSFKISQPLSGYILNSADSINVGTIDPGQTKQVSYYFTAPLHDSVGHYQITVKADNGIYKNVNGTLYIVDPAKFYTVKDGNWNDPATWYTNQVPTAVNSVHVSHKVIVTDNAVCKSVTVFMPGNIIVNTGNQLNIVH